MITNKKKIINYFHLWRQILCLKKETRQRSEGHGEYDCDSFAHPQPYFRGFFFAAFRQLKKIVHAIWANLLHPGGDET